MLEAQPLAKADPAAFAQRSMFLDNQRTAIEFWSESLTDALSGEVDSERFDQSMLADFRKWLKQLFSHGVSEVQIGDGTASTTTLAVRPEGIARSSSLSARRQPSRPRCGETRCIQAFRP